jgi:hypothetical protein
LLLRRDHVCVCLEREREREGDQWRAYRMRKQLPSVPKQCRLNQQHRCHDSFKWFMQTQQRQRERDTYLYISLVHPPSRFIPLYTVTLVGWFVGCFAFVSSFFWTGQYSTEPEGVSFWLAELLFFSGYIRLCVHPWSQLLLRVLFIGTLLLLLLVHRPSYSTVILKNYHCPCSLSLYVFISFYLFILASLFFSPAAVCCAVVTHRGAAEQRVGHASTRSIDLYVCVYI